MIKRYSMALLLVFVLVFSVACGSADSDIEEVEVEEEAVQTEESTTTEETTQVPQDISTEAQVPQTVIEDEMAQVETGEGYYFQFTYGPVQGRPTASYEMHPEGDEAQMMILRFVGEGEPEKTFKLVSPDTWLDLDNLLQETGALNWDAYIEDNQNTGEIFFELNYAKQEYDFHASSNNELPENFQEFVDAIDSFFVNQ